MAKDGHGQKLVDQFWTHGGQNSVTDGLMSEIPLVVLPAEDAIYALGGRSEKLKLDRRWKELMYFTGLGIV